MPETVSGDLHPRQRWPLLLLALLRRGRREDRFVARRAAEAESTREMTMWSGLFAIAGTLSVVLGLLAIVMQEDVPDVRDLLRRPSLRQV